MRIVILGAGQVGSSLAKNLANEDNDISLVDLDQNRLQQLQHRLDIQTVHGCASYPNILIEAGIENADMLIAVTNSDEINMIACQIAYSLFKTPSKIARIRAKNYYGYPELFQAHHIPVDVCISPEQLVTEHIEHLIDYPGVSQVLEFANGRVLMATICPRAGGMMIGKTVQELELHLQNIEASVVALFRQKEALPINATTLIEKDDEVLFIASPEAIHQVLVTLGRYTEPNRRIIIAGGGHIGSRLAETLEKKYRIKIIDCNPNQTHLLAASLHKSTVLQGDIADRDLLVSEHIEFTDVFCAVTNDDETNIMSCLQAKRLGVKYTMALVNRHTYVDLISDSPIDHAISPQLITIGSILTKLRRGNMIKVQRLSDDEAEAIELVLNGNELTSQVIARPLKYIKLPPSCRIAAIVREDKVFVSHPDFVLEANDHVILLLLHKRYISDVEALFQVKLTYTH